MSPASIRVATTRLSCKNPMDGATGGDGRDPIDENFRFAISFGNRRVVPRALLVAAVAMLLIV